MIQLEKIKLMTGGSVSLARAAVKAYADDRGGEGQFDKNPQAWTTMFTNLPSTLQVHYIEVASK